MAIEHTLLRNMIDNAKEAIRILEHLDARDLQYTFTHDDRNSVRSASVMVEQAARGGNQLVGYLDAKLYKG